MRNASRLTLKLTLGRVDVNEQVEESLDGAMSAAPTRGQLPRRQRRHHRHRHHHHHHHHHRQHRQHHRHRHHHLRNNNHHHHHPHHGHTYHGQCQYSPQESPEVVHNSSDNQSKSACKIDDQEEHTEKRPKVNPIFLWALQREQRIIEVRCEDYDKRNRIKLTKTAHGWKSIPRTSSNVYNSCCCVASNYLPTPTVKDNKPASSSPSVTSSCVPCVMSSKSPSSPPSSCSESTSFSSRSSLSTIKSQNDIGDHSKNNIRVKDKNVSKLRTLEQRRYQLSDYESDATRSSCRNSGISYDLSCEDDRHEEPDEVDYDDDDDDVNEHEKYDEYVFDDMEEENTSFVSYGRKTFGLLDLEKLKKNQLLQPRVILEPLNTSRLRLPSLSEPSKMLDDEIEMIIEGEEEEEDEGIEAENIKDNMSAAEENKECISDPGMRKEDDTEDEVEEIEDKEDIEELDEESATVFEYEDRDSVDMMDDEEEIQEREDNVLNPAVKHSTVPEHTFYGIPHPIARSESLKMHKSYLENEVIEEEEDEENEDEEEEEVDADEEEKEIVESVKINQKKRVPGTIPQVPDLKPINESVSQRLSVTSQLNQKCLRVLPSPPCSVTCSDDAASRPDEVVRSNVIQSSTPVEKKQRREAPDLIEVKPTEWRRREQSLRPANQLRELIKRSGGSIPDPLLVPRDRLSILAASPGIEIPRLLITRPELRLPEALSHPEFLTDPDLLVISLAHLQQVLDSVPDPKNPRLEDKNRVDRYVSPSNLAFANGTEKKRLSCKPIGSLMPAPMDLSRHSSSTVSLGQSSILRVRSGLLRRESEVTSTARLPGDDSRLWHPLFGCRQKTQEKSNSKLPLQPQDRIQHTGNYQQQQDSSQHRVSWHRTTLAS